MNLFGKKKAAPAPKISDSINMLKEAQVRPGDRWQCVELSEGTKRISLSQSQPDSIECCM
jgi:hypothetical protein